MADQISKTAKTEAISILAFRKNVSLLPGHGSNRILEARRQNRPHLRHGLVQAAIEIID
jgi:hypothetical protein